MIVRVGVEDVHARRTWATSAVYRPCSSIGQIVGMPAALHDDLVVLAEAGRHVHHTGAVLGRHEVGAEDLEGVFGAAVSAKKSNSGV